MSRSSITRDGIVVAVSRLRNSLSGNPRWRVTWMTEGNSRAEWSVTESDSQVGNVVDPSIRGQRCRIVTGTKGITGIEVLS